MNWANYGTNRNICTDSGAFEEIHVWPLLLKLLSHLDKQIHFLVNITHWILFIIIIIIIIIIIFIIIIIIIIIIIVIIYSSSSNSSSSSSSSSSSIVSIIVSSISIIINLFNVDKKNIENRLSKSMLAL